MIFKPYPKYTSCAIQWFNEIPQSWKQVRVEQYLIKKDENIGDLWSSTQLLSLTQKGIIEKDINEGKGKTHSDYSTYQAIDIGDLVFCLFDIDETPRTVGLSTKKGMITSAYTAFKSKENINTQYVYYFFESLDDAKALKPYYKGLRKTVRPPEFLKIHVPFPPKVEQVAISQFLDTETARIDNLIAKQEKLIELLEEQRKSIISHAVTKGLNPNAPMKDSGVEWLGDVPEHWMTPSSKHLLEIPITDGPHETPNFVDDGVPFISAEAISKGKIDFDKKRGYITPELNAIYSKKYSPKIEDIYMVKSGATTGKVAMVGTTEEFNIWSPLAVFRCNKNKVLPKFLLAVFNSSHFYDALVLNWSYGTQQNIGMGVLSNIEIPCPPLKEQAEIIQHLDAQNTKFDKLISTQSQLIEKLKEYRSSIISHAVTGKIDVREFGA